MKANGNDGATPPLGTIESLILGERFRFDALCHPDALEEAKTLLESTLSLPYVEDEVLDALPQLIAVYSPKGGVGKTNVAVNLAVLLAGLSGGDCVLVDMDIEYGNTGRIMGGRKTPNIFSLLENASEALKKKDIQTVLNYCLVHKRTGLRVMLPPPVPEIVRLEGPYRLREEYFALLGLFESQFRFVVMDCGVSLVSRVTQLALERAEAVVMIADLDLSTLESIWLVLQSFRRMPRMRGKVGLLLNRIPFKGKEEEGSDKKGEKGNERAEGMRAEEVASRKGLCALDLNRVEGTFSQHATFLGGLPYREEITRYSNLGVPYLLLPDREYRHAFIAFLSCLAKQN
ncbi:MAG: AAA family ATPase, partial [Candidatus Hadarchaeales archaeon]